MMSSFVPGLELSRAFYREVVGPLLGEVAHGAALIGPGSEVLGFDTARSADHDWGPRVLVFVAPGMVEGVREQVWSRLPAEFGGYPTAFGSDRHPVRPGVEVAEFGPWARCQLGFDPRGEITVEDWRSAPWQRLAELTSGEVFHDGLGELEAARAGLRWYPPDVWRYVLACQWVRIAQEEAFPGRAAEVGDELGSLLSAGRLVRDLMRLSLLMRRRYPPYGKWLGSAFKRLSGSAELGEALSAALRAGDWRAREEHLCAAYRRVASVQNRLGLAEPVEGSVRPFFARPFRVIGGMRFAEALMGAVSDPRVRELPLVGTVDQFADSTDALTRSDRARSLAAAVR
ncbi:hypothetical protein Aple_086280 [Acrocarpospora pleiomorpha]|uniref:DUF4037 domain-containing protein n=2 Tax=Acrocarpospora pleiomorpha TaxID=90975 RepID=A0A5M3Y0M6_9ACTN|nr:DUF4037 domain-containing protein [Acrocarpospora pleiomorpha]GES25729.1 hypothetical protein Aple_086280 [Acrocarpospora pleiomorpha]